MKRLESEGYEFEAAEGSFELLIRKQLGQHRPLFELHEYHCSFRRSGDGHWNKCEATVKLHVNGEPEYTVAEGDGPVNALDAALRKALRPVLSGRSMRSSSTTTRCASSTASRAPPRGPACSSTRPTGTTSWGTVGVSDNIIEASWLALVDSFEFKLIRERQG